MMKKFNFFEVLKSVRNDSEMILECSRADLRYVSSYFLSVSPAVTWLTVYRRLQVLGLGWGGVAGCGRVFMI